MKMMATAVVYNRLHNSSVGMGGHHTQLARSLERILEEAHFSGELILTNRKLKDFPKTATKYDLTDTVIADLSRNRFCELPEEITTFAFLETLLLYHNSIRSIPESLKRLTSLTYLDLRSNQLSCLPREICFLPLHVLLVSNNRLTSLPDELGRMDRLTDLDVSYNLLTALPARIGELRSLRSLSIRNNQLMYLPRELSCLTLVSLDVGNNRIASLPLEIRQMSSLVVLNLENNPLTSPPASLCVRGLVHVFKFLETQATRDEKGSRAGGNYDGYTTLRRAPRHNTNGNTLEMPRAPRFHVESGFNTCDGHDKQRWSHDMPNGRSTNAKNDIFVRKPSISSQSSQSTDILDTSLTSSTSTIVDDSINDGFSCATSPVEPVESHAICNGFSPDKDEDELMIDHHQLNGKNGNEKANKDLGNIQTYKEYKEALKQQRNQEISSVYKAKGALQHDVAVNAKAMEQGDNESLEVKTMKPVLKPIIKNCNPSLTNGRNGYTNYAQLGAGDSVILPKKPIQKVIPSRNIELLGSQSIGNEQTADTLNKSLNSTSTQNFGDCIGYVKPSSPMKILNGNGLVTVPTNVSCVTNLPTNNNNNNNTTKSALNGNSSKLSSAKSNRTVTWNRDIPSELLSFTMRREFDRQREETELMTQLRNIIETRLKMTLPDDIASALTDGVILCHLANYVHPRSVASIHVPSPGVSKLTMARCRRNVDNFLEACRKIGVDEELICSCLDVVQSCPNPLIQQTDHDNDNDTSPQHVLPNPSALLKTVSALIAIMEKPTAATTATALNYTEETFVENEENINNNNNNNNNNEIQCNMQKQKEFLCDQQQKQQSTATATGTKQQIVIQNVIPLKSILKSHKNANTINNNNNNDKTSNDFDVYEKDIGSHPSHYMPLHVHKIQNISSKYFYGNMCDKNMYYNEKLHYNNHAHHNTCQDGEEKQHELPLRVNVNYSMKTSTDVVDAAQEYKLLQLYANYEDTDQMENTIAGQNTSKVPPLVSKRIEFFEHTTSTPNTMSTTSSPKETMGVKKSTTAVKELPAKKVKSSSSIFSIYRVADFAAAKALDHDFDKEKEETVLLKHDSNILTALLSIIFIGTFLLLIFFPLSG